MNGKFHGVGTLTRTDGSVQKGRWKDGEFLSSSTANPSSPPSTSAPSNSSIATTSPTSPTSPKDDGIKLLGFGSGFSVTHSGHIITNHHVIEDCDQVVAIHQGKFSKLSKIFADKINDLALMKGDLKSSHPFRISRRDPQLTEDIFVAGFPTVGGPKQNTTVKVFKGVVSSMAGHKDNLSHFQIDAATNSGNSGGPIFNDSGNILGVLTYGYNTPIKPKHLAELSKGKPVYLEIYQGQNYGVKSSVVLSLLESNGVIPEKPNKGKISRDELRKLIHSATYRLICFGY